ncbi:expressed unknown protein [Seminavis robusta]|uniref:Uncharacterized protein n=1 Tax=Seminavis robusta TaxID=568900 RepID=A0A9N8EVU0_9STRA|nr:expressed unknown protein [Seminavis robusta]|eukprot:Sro1837_g300720.1 n/a (1095) ;mRNA; r:4579-7863
MSPEPEPLQSRSDEEANNDESSMVPEEVSVTSSAGTRNSKRTESVGTCNSSTSSHSSRSKDWTEATQPPSGSITTCSGSSCSEQNPDDDDNDDDDDEDDQQSVSSFHSTNTHAMDISETSADMDGSPPALALTIDQDEDQDQEQDPQKTDSEQDQDQDQDQNQDKSDHHKESSSEEERQIVTFQVDQQELEVEELQLVAYNPNSQQPSHKRRLSTGSSTASTIRRSDLSSTSQHLGHFHKPLDPQEEERRRNEVSAAMEILEHMRRANLVMEFGPGVDLHACVFCLREERKRQHNNNDNSNNNNAHPTCHKKPKPTLQDFLLPKFKPRNKECLICHTPVCKQHWDSGFYFQQNVILCQDCAPLFDLDNLVECMNLNNNTKTTTKNTNSNETSLVVAQQQQQQIQKAQQEQHMRQLLIVYDRALLALRHSSQSFDDNARRRLAQTNWHKEGLGIGSSVTNIASGVTGIAATAVFMTPWGSWLLLTSLALGGIATAVGSGSFLVERLCPQTRQAEQTIALASMVDSLLEATAILRQARIAGALPPASFDASEHDDYDDDEDFDDFDDDASMQSIRSLPRLPPVPIRTADSSSDATALFLQEDKEQQLMITILKAKMDAETRRARNPLQSAMKRINKQVKDHQRKHPRLRRLNRRNKNDSTTFCSSNNDGGEGENAGEEVGPLKRVACRVRKEVTRAKKKTGEAVVVAKTATALAAVGMSEGGVGFIRRFGGKPHGATVAKSSPSTSSAPAEKDDTESKTAEMKCEATGEGTHSDQTGGNDKTNDDQTKTTSATKQPQQRRVSFRDEMTAARQGVQFFTRNLFNVGSMGNGDDDENKKQQKNTDESVVVRQPSFKTVRFPFKDVLVRVFLVRSNTKGPATNDLTSSNERALVAKIRNKNMDLKLRASDRVMQAFTRTNVKVAKQDVKRDRRQRLMASGESDGEQAPSNQVFVKNARFLVKASLTVLRETARYAGGAFSAAIVCVETMELQEKVKRIRGKGLRSANAEKLEQLKHHLWENQGSFPDTTTLEWELSGNAKGEIVEIFDGDGNSSIPHWSSSYEGQRPDGSCANLPIMEDSLSIPAYGYTMELSTPYHLH